nr:reverse transcriptase domain-containing protein [Tanacetum cinerariifolium]
MNSSPSSTTNHRNEISNFQQRFDESFHEAWDRYKDLLRACPHHGGNLLERRTQDVLTIIENKSKVRNSRNKSIVSQVKSSDANSNSSFEIAKLTHAVIQQTSACLAAGGNTFSKVRDNIQGYVAAAAVNYNQRNLGYRPLGQSYQALTQQNQVVPLSELEKVKRMNEADMKAMQTQINNAKNELRNEMKNSIEASMFREDERIEESLMDQDLAKYTIKVPLPLVQKSKPPSQRNFFLHQRDPLHPNIPYPSRMYKQKQQEKDEVQIYKFWQMFKQLHINITLADALILIPKYQKMLKALFFNKEKLLELANTPLNVNYSAVILKKLPEKLGDHRKFLIPFGFSELKCKALTDFVASINLMPLSVWKKLGLLELISTRMTIELANRTICTPAGIARDVFVPVGKFTFPADFVIVDYEKSINLINVFNDSSGDFLKNLFSTNHQSGNPTFSPHPKLTSPEVKDDVFDPEGGNVLPEKLLDLNSTKDFHPPHHVNPLSGSTTSSSSPTHLLEEFVDELALNTFPPGNDDLPFDIESNLKEIEYLLHHDPIKDIDSILKDSIDQSNLADLNDNLVDTMPEMFTDEHALDYSSPPLYDEYDDDLFEVESDTEYVYDDRFDSKGKKIKESKLLIDELDLPSDFLPSPKYDSFLSEDFFKVDALPSTNNEDKKRRKFFATKRAEEKRNKSPTKAQQKNIMCTYLKNIDGWKLKSLKKKSFAEIQELFDKAMKKVNTYVDFKTELVEESSKKSEAKITQEGSLNRVGDELEQERSKKQNV